MILSVTWLLLRPSTFFLVKFSYLKFIVVEIYNVRFICINRVFVNRSLHLEKIKFYGFDMDYTLAGSISLSPFLFYSMWQEQKLSILFMCRRLYYTIACHYNACLPVFCFWACGKWMINDRFQKMDAEGTLEAYAYRHSFLLLFLLWKIRERSTIGLCVMWGQVSQFQSEFNRVLPSWTEYISPAYEKMGFDLCRDYLVTMGYPQEIQEFEYDPSFALRY